MSSNNNQHRVVKEDAPQQPAMSSMAPPMPFGQSVVSTTPAKITPTSQISTSTKPTAVVGKAWKISQLRPVPSFYKLERTHIKIDDASASEIAMRITEVLRQESVRATFHDEEVRSVYAGIP